ncbi:hypothetical protein MRX96_018905 [Rhipicephalus microplus]
MFRRVVTGVSIFRRWRGSFSWSAVSKRRSVPCKHRGLRTSSPPFNGTVTGTRGSPSVARNLPKIHRRKEQNRYNEELQKAKPTATRYLYIIRHGQYNMRGESDKDFTLTELGRKQADATGQRLKELGVPFSRLGAPIPPEPPYGTWRPEAKFFTDGARIEAGFRKYFYRASPSQKEDSHEIIVCHANVIRYWICRALQFPPEAWSRISLANCSISLVRIPPSGRVSLRSLGDTGHFPQEMITTS